MKIEKRIWTHEPPKGREDFRGQERVCIIDSWGDVVDHFDTVADAQRHFEMHIEEQEEEEME